MTSVRGRLSADKGGSVAEDAAALVFDAIYRAFFVRLVRHATWRFRLSKEDASEVVQDAFMVALVKLDRESEPGPAASMSSPRSDSERLAA
jgi:DNA-directed RNA polymerase specialized sigma24 family protein